MYSGRSGFGGGLPYGFGDVPPSGYGPYLGDSSVYNLGNIFDDIAKIAGKVGIVSNELSNVASGESNVATVPKDKAVLVVPLAGGLSKSIPLMPLVLGVGVLAFLAFRRK
jgi:hypothetical protein